MKSWLTRLFLVAFGCGLFLAGVNSALADEGDDERARRAREISESINSPFCPASTLASCGSPQAASWRHEIRGWVDEGLTKNEICERLEDRVQHQLCVGPRRPWMWSLPFLLAGASIALLAFVLRRFVRPAEESPLEQSKRDQSASSNRPKDVTGRSRKRQVSQSEPTGQPDAHSSDLDAQLDRELEELE